MDQDEFQALFIELDYRYFGQRVVRAGWYAKLLNLRRGTKVVKNTWGDRRKIEIERYKWSFTDYNAGMILVDRRLELQQRRAKIEIRLTLLHEMVHADLFLLYPNDDEEHGSLFVGELRRLAQACRTGAKWPCWAGR